jgi:hypothetical protein
MKNNKPKEGKSFNFVKMEPIGKELTALHKCCQISPTKEEESENKGSNKENRQTDN